MMIVNVVNLLLLLALAAVFWKFLNADELQTTEVFVTNSEAQGTGRSEIDRKSDTVIDDDYNNYVNYVKILVIEEIQFRTALSDSNRIWENGIVPFEISGDYRDADRNLILEAMNDFRNQTCINFRPRRNESSFIFILPGSGCSAVVGKIPTASNVSLARGCLVKGIVLHELMHTLGFTHEQNRPDRDRFVQIVFDNIVPGTERNFDKLSEDEVKTFNQSYDYGSIMHYGNFEFAKDRTMPSIIPLRNGVEIGQREGFSETDVTKINILYNCTR